MAETLQLRIKGEYFLDAGSWQLQSNDSKTSRLVAPPIVSMYDQVIAQLGKPQDLEGEQTTNLEPGEIALATVLVCMRWGSYFSVLVNPDLPEWPAASVPTLSRITQTEMARMNIEMSYSLSRWINLLRSDPEQFQKLARVALELLPPRIKIPSAEMPATSFKKSHFKFHALRVAGRHGIKELALKDVGQEWTTKRIGQIALNPDRFLANGLITECWRAGMIEEIQAGSGRPDLPLVRQRRITRREELLLMRTTTKFMIPIIIALLEDMKTGDPTSWPEQVLAYECAGIRSPYNWSLSESSREVHIDGMEA